MGESKRFKLWLSGPVPQALTPRVGLLWARRWQQALGGSRGIDVTGGMQAKVNEMLALAEGVSSLVAVQIISGLCPGLLQSVLSHPEFEAGTRIRVIRR